MIVKAQIIKLVKNNELKPVFGFICYVLASTYELLVNAAEVKMETITICKSLSQNPALFSAGWM
jgi:hypothetical protein